LTVGEDLNRFLDRLPREGFPIQKLLGLLRLYGKISGDVIPPFLDAN
jgi:hypothetical protein